MLEDIRLAFQGIWNHKLRSALTMLGIIIGIGSIIAIVSTIKGTNEQIKENLVGAGNNAVNIQLYQGEWPIDLSYGNVPDGVPVISKDVLEEIKESDAVENGQNVIITDCTLRKIKKCPINHVKANFKEERRCLICV